jgi:predicted glycosyltransferase
MNEADFFLSGDLDEFLPLKKRGRRVHLVFEDHQTVKHLVESLGIPHVEIGEMRVAGAPVGFEYRPRNGDQIELRPAAPGSTQEPRFLLDNHLGRLAAYLRMLGFDCLYRNDFEDSDMVNLLLDDPRILLTRDRRFDHLGQAVPALHVLQYPVESDQ